VGSIHPRAKAPGFSLPLHPFIIRQMWRAGQKNQAEIARQIGYHRATVFDAVKRMIEAGELEK